MQDLNEPRFLNFEFPSQLVIRAKREEKNRFDLLLSVLSVLLLSPDWLTSTSYKDDRPHSQTIRIIARICEIRRNWAWAKPSIVLPAVKMLLVWESSFLSFFYVLRHSMEQIFVNCYRYNSCPWGSCQVRSGELSLSKAKIYKIVLPAVKVLLVWESSFLSFFNKVNQVVGSGDSSSTSQSRRSKFPFYQYIFLLSKKVKQFSWEHICWIYPHPWQLLYKIMFDFQEIFT